MSPATTKTVSPVVTTDDSLKKYCRICHEVKNEEDIQELNCHHKYCSLCMTLYPGTLCPKKFCLGTRSTDVVVDEMSGNDNEAHQISFGSTSALFKIEIGEKLRCEAFKKGHKCENIAQIVLTHCRHRLCSDCLFNKVKYALEHKLQPRCAFSKCCNILTLQEIQSLGATCPQFRDTAILAERQMPKSEIPLEKEPLPTEILIECYVYTNESNKKTIVLPKACFLVDAVNAVVQLLRVSKKLSTMDLFIRKDCTEKKGKYKYEKIITEGRITLKDAQWTDKTILVVDQEKLILRNRKH